MEKKWVGSVFVVLGLVLVVFAVGYSARSSIDNNSVTGQLFKFSKAEITSKPPTQTRVPIIDEEETYEDVFEEDVEIDGELSREEYLEGFPRCAMVEVRMREEDDGPGLYARSERGSTLNSYISGGTDSLIGYLPADLLQIPAKSGNEACGFLNELSLSPPYIKWECVQAYDARRQPNGAIIDAKIRDCREIQDPLVAPVSGIRINPTYRITVDYALCCRFD